MIDPIVNGKFDGTWNGWTGFGGGGKSVDDINSYEGVYCAYIYYYKYCGTYGMGQSITIPDVPGIINLEFFERTRLYARSGSCGIRFDDDWMFRINYSVSGRQSVTTDWAKQIIDVSAYRGQTVNLNLVWSDTGADCSDADHGGWIRIDDIKLVQPEKTVSGTITFRSGIPLSGSIVTIDGNTDTTDASGQYSITIAPGTYTITAEHPLIKTASQTLVVSADMTQDLTLYKIETRRRFAGRGASLEGGIDCGRGKRR